MRCRCPGSDRSETSSAAPGRTSSGACAQPRRSWRPGCRIAASSQSRLKNSRCSYCCMNTNNYAVLRLLAWAAPDMSANIPLHRLKAIQKRYELREVSLHSLRHTNATLRIQQGINVQAISGRLGHSQASTTMNIYAHPIQSADAAAEAVELALYDQKKA